MVMTLWWVSLALIALAVVAAILAYRSRPRRVGEFIVAANTEYLATLPSVRRSHARAVMLRVCAVVASAALVVASALLAGRVASERVHTPIVNARDIVLCMDVSGSMTTYARGIALAFGELAENFDGERVGLAIFNMHTRTIFPLTNDYTLIQSELERAASTLEYNELSQRWGSGNYTAEQRDAFIEFVGPTLDPNLPPSLIGDGVASCAQLFDQQDHTRSRFMVLATDNEPGGPGIYELDTAMDTVIARDISVYTLYPGSYQCFPECGTELEDETLRTGGQFYRSSDPQAVPGVVNEIEKAQAVEIGASPQVLRTDHPMALFVLSLVAAIAVIATGFRRR